LLSLHIWNTDSMYGQIYVENADNTGGHVIGQLYKITYRTKSTSFSCLRYQKITHTEGDTMLVLDVRECVEYSDGWKDVHVLMNGRMARFKIWAFMDLIDTSSIKLVK